MLITHRWVSKATHNKVEKIVDEAPEPSQAMVINCVTFKSEWKHRFNASETTPSTFTSISGAQKDVAIMKLDREILVLETDKFKAVQLPYDDRYYLILLFQWWLTFVRFVATAILPLESGIVALNQIIKDLGESTVAWKEFSAQFKGKETALFLPRVTVEYHE